MACWPCLGTMFPPKPRYHFPPQAGQWEKISQKACGSCIRTMRDHSLVAIVGKTGLIWGNELIFYQSKQSKVTRNRILWTSSLHSSFLRGWGVRNLTMKSWSSLHCVYQSCLCSFINGRIFKFSHSWLKIMCRNGALWCSWAGLLDLCFCPEVTEISSV